MNIFISEANGAKLIAASILAVIITAFSYAIGYFLGAPFNIIEALAVLTSYMCTYLFVRQTRMAYIAGVITTILWCIFFVQIGALGLATFNGVLTFSLLYGWYRWDRDDRTIPVTNIALPWYFGYFLFGALVFGLFLGLNMLFNPTGISELNPIDVSLAVLSAQAQLMLDNKKYESWYLWMIINIISVPFFFSIGYPVTAIQYIFFFVNACYGLWEWNRSKNLYVLS